VIPDDLSATIAAQLGIVTGLAAFGNEATFPYTGPEQAIYVTRTLDRRTETEYSSTFGNTPGQPNLYTIVLVTGRFRPGLNLAAAQTARSNALVAIRGYFMTKAGRRLNTGSGDLCAKAGVPLEVRNDPQGRVISYLKDAFVGAYITLGVEEAYITV
jgi:hypothetical protein